jgi:hypothetical protein
VGIFAFSPPYRADTWLWVSREKAFLPALYIEECRHSLNKRLPIGFGSSRQALDFENARLLLPLLLGCYPKNYIRNYL